MSRLLVPALAAALCLGACATDDDVGRAELTLTGTSPSGHTYRLRDAELVVAGPGGPLTLRTEDDPSRAQIDFRVRAGAYTLAVTPGWRLERVAADGAAQPVEAELLSPNPQPFDIVADGFTPIVLRFRARGEVVDMGEGAGGVRLDVDDVPDAGMPAPAITVSPASLDLTEDDFRILDVSLTALPPDDGVVFVQVRSSSPSLHVSPPSLLFTSAPQRQSVHVHVLRDADDRDEDAFIEVIPSRGGAPVRVPVHVADVDVQAIVPSMTALTITEGQATALNVHLSAQPAGPVVVQVASESPELIGSPAVLTFTPENYAVDQVVTLSAAQDDDGTSDSVSVQLSAPGVAAVGIAVEIQDDDLQRIVVDPAQLVMTEGTLGLLSVRLTVPPTERLTLFFDAPTLGISPSQVEFTPASWSTPRTVMVAAASDPDDVDHTAVITVRPDRVGMVPVRVPVRVVDDER